MFPTLGSQFMHGSSTSNLLYGNYNQACETFMAEHCAQHWDGFCEAYQKMNIDSYWPNSGVIDAYAFCTDGKTCNNSSTGIYAPFFWSTENRIKVFVMSYVFAFLRQRDLAI